MPARAISLGATTLLLALVSSLGQAAETVEAFYKGKTIEVHIGNPPGASYDLYGRLVSKYLGRHLPGQPQVVVKHMPGAGGLTMTNWLYNIAPKDGTALAVALHATAVEQALGSAGIQYDAAAFSWIGRMSPVVEVSYTWHTSPTKTLADAQKRETVMGGSSPTAPSIWYLKVLNVLAQTKFKIIPGFQGANDSHLAMERGELEGTTKAWPTMKSANADLLRDKKVNILVQYGLERSPELPDVPLMSDMAHSNDDKTALSFYAMGNAVGRSLVGAPGIPPDRLAALRSGFMKMMEDKELIAEAEKTNIDIGPVLDGAALHKVIQDTLAISPAVVKRAKSARDE
jgi:tripartite-type tricarboxylate transporter receptor subunit TctC